MSLDMDTKPAAKADAKALKAAQKALTRKARFDREMAPFLPAALEILETPPNPVGRSVMWLVIAAAAGALTWASLAEVDMVAVSEGRVIPRTRLQTVEAADAGVIRAIRVREGDRVGQGEPLIDLDPTFADADGAAARTEFAAAQLARARADALLSYAAGQGGAFKPPEGADPRAAAAETAAVHARIAALQERLSGVSARIDGATADLRRLEETLPLIRSQHQSRSALLAKGLAAKEGVLQLEERMIASAREAESRRAEIAALETERAQAIAEFRGQAAAEKAEAEAIVATRTASVKKAEAREGYQTLSAPVAGTVHEVGVTTVGEVVEAGGALVTLVPEGAELIVEALILNRDIGHVRVGDAAAVKLEAYPFTRHGFLEGVVERVSPDSIADEQRGLVFPARIRITGSKLRGPDGAPIALGQARLSPGMTAQVEVRTGTRSVLSYILSPIAKATSEAGRER